MKRWILFALTAIVLALVVTVWSYILAERARIETERYLRVAIGLHIGTSYGVVIGELRNAGLSMKPFGDCRRKCALVFDVNDKWLYRLHLAAPAEFLGRLDFDDQKLAYKSTAMGREMCCSATVVESESTISRVHSGNLDTSGHPYKVKVDLAANDFTHFRTLAYAYDVSCIGSTKACRSDEYLPIPELERMGPK